MKAVSSFNLQVLKISLLYLLDDIFKFKPKNTFSVEKI